jgi:cell division transport system permease protein
LSATPQITVYVALNASSEDSKTLHQQLKEVAGVAKVDFLSKDQALTELQDSMGEKDLINVLDENPLPDAFIITPKSSIPTDVKALREVLANMPMVDQANMDTEWLTTLYQMHQFANKVVWFLSITLSVAFVLVAHNTIRLQSLSQRDEIEVSKLLGAPASFIRRPFLYQAWWQGLFATVLSLGLCAWLMKLMTPLLSDMLSPYGVSMVYRFFTPVEIVGIFGLMTLLAILGAYLATKQHLNSLKA